MWFDEKRKGFLTAQGRNGFSARMCHVSCTFCCHSSPSTKPGTINGHLVCSHAALEARRAIRDIEEMNLGTILSKHDQAQSSIRRAAIYLGFVSTLTFLIIFSFLFKLPDMVEGTMRREKVSRRGQEFFSRPAEPTLSPIIQFYI